LAGFLVKQLKSKEYHTQPANGLNGPNLHTKGATVKQEQFEPKIIAFICNWCAYGAADLAGVSRLQYPPNVRAIRVMCSATVSPHHILRALQDGADGILVGG
jgi:F420-non-reducing hydrogenase iron-sulfur subunit